QIIYPSANTYGERDYADNFRLNLKNKLNCELPVIRYDAGSAANDDAFELLIGETNRSQSKALYDNIGANNLKVEFSGNKILVGSSIPTDIGRALNALYMYISELAEGTYDGNYMMPCGYKHSEVAYEWFDNIPMMSTGTLTGVDDTGKESMVYVWEDVEQSDYESYLSELKSNGLIEKQTYALGDNRYMLLENHLAQVYVYYTSANKTVRLFVENKENGTVYPSATPAEYVTEQGYEPTLWQVECDWKTALEWDTSLPEKWRGSNAGMCYMLKVADGSFVIIDSGMYSKKQADIIWEHLKANSDDEKPVISAWYFSHTHADHIGGFQQFTKYYKDKVTVKAFYFNIPAEGFGSESGMGDTSLLSLMKQYTGATIYRKLHTGMTFYVADARFDVMYTHEDLYPVISKDFNESSTVIRVTFGGKRIMFLGDVQDEGGKVMTDTMPKSEM
ncbi:MAG: MBL fold metallo-hydrolase, partial [Clostridia bacterium]|nr:MBL fold metallo-hydrolase [Clostridia bacterium]